MKRAGTVFLLVAALALVLGCTDKRSELTPAPKSVAEAIETLGYPDDDRDPARRLAAIQLGISAHPAALKALHEHVLNDADPKVRAACSWALGRITNGTSLAFLLQGLSDRDPAARYEAMNSLAKLDGPEAKRNLELFVTQIGGDDGAMAVRALSTMGFGVDALPNEIRLTERGMMESPDDSKSIYVDASHGSDKNDGSEANPYRTLARGVSALRSGKGDTLYATAGERDVPFREQVTVGPDQAGFAWAPTTLSAWPGKPAPKVYPSERVELTDLQGTRTSIPFKGVPTALFYLGEKTTILDRVENTDQLTPGTYCVSGDPQKLELFLPDGAGPEGSLEIGRWRDAILVENADYVRIVGFEAAYAADTGIDFENSYHGALIGGKVHDCDRHGVFYYYAPFGTVSGTEVHGCRYQGISIRSSHEIVVAGVNVHDNSVDGVLFLFDSDGGVVTGSTLTGNGRGVAFVTGSSLGRVIGATFDDNGDELFVDPQSSAQLIPGTAP
jgi:Right handed beta helix region/HEAT repeats